MNKDIALEIHDIKDIVEIPDITIFIYYALILLAFVLLSTLLIFIIKYFKNKKYNQRKTYVKTLENIEFTNSKEDAYIITKNLRLLARNENEKNLAEELTEKLEEYKYKKEVQNMNKEIKVKLSIFLDVLDV